METPKSTPVFCVNASVWAALRKHSSDACSPDVHEFLGCGRIHVANCSEESLIGASAGNQKDLLNSDHVHVGIS